MGKSETVHQSREHDNARKWELGTKKSYREEGTSEWECLLLDPMVCFELANHQSPGHSTNKRIKSSTKQYLKDRSYT